MCPNQASQRDNNGNLSIHANTSLTKEQNTADKDTLLRDVSWKKRKVGCTEFGSGNTKNYCNECFEYA